MHVGTKKVAAAGLLVAFSVILIWLASVIETSSLFFIAAASFCIGIAIREWGIYFGFAFLIASCFINLLVTPQKMYCFTFAGMGFYLWVSEWLYHKIGEANNLKYRNALLWIGKIFCFNMMYIPILFFAPQILFKGRINGLSAIVFLILGQILLYVYDISYRYFQAQVWGKLRKHFIEKGEK